jgi:hypothetical protein
MKLHQKIFGIGLLTAVIVPHLYEKGYNWAFQEAGFREIHWHKETISPQSIEQFGEEFWRDALDYPIYVYIECVK